MEKRNSPSILKLVLMSLALVLVITYLVISLNTNDPFWFDQNFDEVAFQIVVHCYGSDVAIEPGSPNFEPLNQLFNQTLSGPKRWDPLSMSDATYQDYQTHPKMMSIQAFYAPPVRVHSNVKFFSNVTTLIIPLDARHSASNAVFGRNQTYPVAGSLHVESTALLTEYLVAEGLCR